MPSLHISKVAVGCATVDSLQSRQTSRLEAGLVPLVTRFMPKRAEELVGGSIFWIIKHRLTVRQRIVGLAEREEDRKTVISLDPELVLVQARAKRAHQGWRYLAPEDAPGDLGDDECGLALLPPTLSAKLSALALV